MKVLPLFALSMIVSVIFYRAFHLTASGVLQQIFAFIG